MTDPNGRKLLTAKAEEAASSVPSCLDQPLNNSLSVIPSRDAGETRQWLQKNEQSWSQGGF